MENWIALESNTKGIEIMQYRENHTNEKGNKKTSDRPKRMYN